MPPFRTHTPSAPSRNSLPQGIARTFLTSAPALLSSGESDRTESPANFTVFRACRFATENEIAFHVPPQIVRKEERSVDAPAQDVHTPAGTRKIV